MSDIPRDMQPDDEFDLPEGLTDVETCRYLLEMAFPDADPQAIEEGIGVLTSTTLGELRQGKRLTMDVIYEAAGKLETVFPVKK
ncbi:hypothetical protein [Streptomyces sp. NPDC059649]|uniref:hypothetical protein n=1 Tax=Streptomyces sp. NPDC059649 TaxID=3346895 RepID=UPI0036B8F747